MPSEHAGSTFRFSTYAGENGSGAANPSKVTTSSMAARREFYEFARIRAIVVGFCGTKHHTASQRSSANRNRELVVELAFFFFVFSVDERCPQR
jgi:hypothetical protein